MVELVRRGVSAFALLQRAGNLRAIRSDELERWLLAEGFAVRCDGTPRLVPTPLGLELGGCIDRLESSRRDWAYSDPMRVRPNPAVGEVIGYDPPFGFAGEMITPRRDPPPPPPAEALVIEPPPWAGQVGPPLPVSEPADPAAMGAAALAEIRAREEHEQSSRAPDNSDEDEIPISSAASARTELPARFGPVVQNPPLIPLQIPPVDWRQEQLERARLEEPALAEELPRPHPPASREKP